MTSQITVRMVVNYMETFSTRNPHWGWRGEVKW